MEREDRFEVVDDERQEDVLDQDEYFDEDEDEDDFDDGYYEIGAVRNDECLVCYGEDCPDTFDDWLQDIVDDFNGLNWEMEDVGQTLSTSDLNSFLDKIGVQIERKSLERCCCSGSFVRGWVNPQNQSKVEARAQQLLGQLQAEVEAVVGDS